MTRECFDCEYFQLHRPPEMSELLDPDWDFDDLEASCHRWPPSPNGRFPRVVASDWCGEYRARVLVPDAAPEDAPKSI